MSVQQKELSPGSQLIMGLNPPFGVNAALANKFIDKALAFKPKLLILIVPAETERLEKKRTPYDLVWEDAAMLAGKSFYLPGSVDVNNNELEDWNLDPPPLYLWSRPDWTAKHRAIAQQQRHLSRAREQRHLEDDHDLNSQPLVANGDLEQSELHEPLQERGASVSQIQKEGFPVGSGESEVPGSHSHEENQSNKNSNKKRKRNRGKHGREFLTERVTESRSDFRTASGPAFAGDIATSYGNSYVGGGNLGGQFGLYHREYRPDFHSYGQQYPSVLGQRTSFLGGQQRPGHLGLLAADSSYNTRNVSTMQRYAPRLDELNHTRTNTSWYDPVTAGRNGIPDPRATQNGYVYPPSAYWPFWQ